MKAGSRRALFQPFLLILLAACLGLPLFYFHSSTQAQAPKDAAPVRVDPPLPTSPGVSKVESTRPVPPLSGALRAPRPAPNADRIPFDKAVAARIKADVTALSAFSSRMPGTPDYGRAASWVEKRFRESGLQKVRYEEFNVTVPRTLKCELKINGQNVKLLPVYPNGVVPACTPEAGLTAPLIYAGEGRARDFNGQVVKDSIVALDFNSGMNWITAADLGARAVIFLQPKSLGTRGEAEAKFSNLPVEFPRFYAPLASVQRILAEAGTSTKQGATANLLSLVKWERVKGRNIVGEIKGNDAARAQKPGDTLVVNAYYDSMSIVPDSAPGAEAAGNLAALLEIARTYSKKPQPYSLTFVANGAHHLALAGTRHFLANHFLERAAKKDKDGKEIEGSGSPTKKDKDGKDIKEPAFYRGFIGLDLSSRTATVGLFAKSAFYNQMGA
ncbi:MAG TPA: M28 family peptidase, partial [Abditibacteriaceae bacterium]